MQNVQESRVVCHIQTPMIQACRVQEQVYDCKMLRRGTQIITRLGEKRRDNE